VLGNCIGGRNYALFVAFLCSATAALGVFCVCAIIYAADVCLHADFAVQSGGVALWSAICSTVLSLVGLFESCRLLYGPLSLTSFDWIELYGRLGDMYEAVQDGLLWRGFLPLVGGLSGLMASLSCNPPPDLRVQRWLLPLQYLFVIALCLVLVIFGFSFIVFHLQNLWNGITTRARFKEWKWRRSKPNPEPAVDGAKKET